MVTGADHGTFAGEVSLPRLPLPSLSDSCALFLEWCAPLLSPDELTRTTSAVEKFLAPNSSAHQVQAALAEQAADPAVDSWLDDFWRSRYLGRRDRIALNANFFFLFRDLPAGADDATSPDRQATVAATIIARAVAYHRALADETLPASTQRDEHLSMEGNRHLFSTTRISGIDIDTVRTPYTAEWPGPSCERHIVVLCNGSMFRLDVVAPDGTPFSSPALALALQEIRSSASDRGPGVGALTTLARPEWARVRATLLATDAEQLDVLERALFCVCLDGTTPESADAAGTHLLAGDSGTRWFDKTLSFVVFADGTAGVNCEHCSIDGTNVIELVDAIFTEPASAGLAHPPTVPAWQTVSFTVDDELSERIEQARSDFAAFAADSAMMLRTYDGVGSNAIKELGVSPDAFVQLSIQLAHRRVKGVTGATYESITTRRFLHGRTEAMRVVTPQAVAFVDAMVDAGRTAAERRGALQAAATAHVQRAGACRSGLAPEQHLWQLQLVATRLGHELPGGLYESPGWLVMRDDYLSTSAVPSTNVVAFGFGATGQHCIGVAYVLGPEALSVYLATPRSGADQLAAFAEALPVAFGELTDVLA